MTQLRRSIAAVIGAVLVQLSVASFPVAPLAAQPVTPRTSDTSADSAQLPSRVTARLIGIERAQAIFFDALASGRGPIDQAGILRTMAENVSGSAPAVGAAADPGAADRFAALGAPASALLRGGFAFRREVAAIIAGTPAAERRAALDEAVRRYQRRPAALPDAPKDMTILYDHPYTSFVAPQPPETEPHRALAYPRLTGVLWSARWYELAILEPLDSAATPDERDRGLAIVDQRLARKLSGGEPPDGYPTELPLAPAIAPGLVTLNERAAAIVDNFSMMLDVMADVLTHPAVSDRAAALNQVVEQFSDRRYRCVQTDEWIVVALRHSIFDQGGFALAPMERYERNPFSGGHGQHYAVKRPPPECEP